MVLINNLLILFVFTMFAQSSALKTVDHPPTISIIQEESKSEQYEKMVQGHPTAIAVFKLFQSSLEQTSFTEDEKEQILSVAFFAAEKHQAQVRKDANKTPYIVHPIGVADQLITLARVRDVAIIQAALLHDTVEDTETTFEEIKGEFGEEVASLVAEVTDDKSLSREERRRIKIVSAPEMSEGAALIKLSDVCYNIRDVITSPPPSWSQERCDGYVRWATEFVDNLSYKDSVLKARFDRLVVAPE